ncbi:hypothetical protein OH77DRAFT_1434208 [Trametes cingulata]|nr:hypothetical protein OH77DRAFT_1434208 [Trametes cingulata]
MSNSTNSFPPPGESPADLWLEKSNLDGAVLGGVAYGVHLAVFAQCFYTIYFRGAGGSRDGRGRSRWLLVYIFMLFAMGTVNVACNTRMTQLMFIDNRGYPGGPNAWFFTFYSTGVNIAGDVAYIVANFLADGLLLWRTYMVWNSAWICIFPAIVYLASTAMSIMVIVQSSYPNSNLWASTTVQFLLPYFAISISLNVMLTLLLVGRLMYMSYRARQSLGAEHARTYMSIAAMLVESAVPYAVTAIIFVITYAENSNVQNLLLPVLAQIMCINPEVIILRVATGRAVNSKPSTSARTGGMTSIQFESRARTKNSSFALSTMATSEASDPTLSGRTIFGSRPDLYKDETSSV